MEKLKGFKCMTRPAPIKQNERCIKLTPDIQGREVKRLAINNFGKDLQMSMDLSNQPSRVYQTHWVKVTMWLDSIQLMKE
jgi:hypothetical protein